ncbi:hypothetical protein E4T49_03894 [Aureobasidium sp. EXF-10728]|nr:hypothetical protein E4T49_03894 [Aureobasidium sp. EXF-10728]
MSWMDSWSRPKKNAATPPPLYLTSDQVRYCHTCGRVIGSRKSNSAKTAATEVKFCSDRCKRHKLRPADKRIEAAFAALLDGQDASQFAAVQADSSTPGEEISKTASNQDTGEKPHDKYDYSKNSSKKKQQKVKGDPRILVSCSEVETLIYGSREDPEKTFGRKKNRARRGVTDDDVWKSIDMVDSDTDTGTAETASADEDATDSGGGAKVIDNRGVPLAEALEDNADADVVKIKGRVRPPQSESDVNGSVGGEKGWAERINETPEMLQKRREGQRRAEEKEMVKCAARRAVVFGLESSRVMTGEAKKGKKAKDDEDGEVKQEGRRMCEAVMHGAVVEPSYAKGDWSIRWREE